MSDQAEALVNAQDQFLQGNNQEPQEVIPTPAYVSFVSTKTKNDSVKEAVRSAGGTIPGVVLTRAGVVTPLRPFKFHVFQGRILYTKLNKAGNKVEACKTKITDSDKGFGDHAVVLVGVVQGDFITPALITNFRTGAVKAVKNALVARQDCEKDSWFRGPAYEVAKAFRYPAGRFVATGSIRVDKVTSGDNEGMEYYVGMCSVNPSGLEDCQRFQTAINDPGFLADHSACQKIYNSKIEAMLKGEEELEDI